jgi:hypothetical protein
MFFIPGVVFTTEYIHKFIKDGPGLEVPSPGVFALHGGSVECVISGFRHTEVCLLALCQPVPVQPAGIVQHPNFAPTAHESSTIQAVLGLCTDGPFKIFKQSVFVVLGLLVIG